MPAAEILRLGRAVPDTVCALFCFAQRARWAAAMRRRAEADIVRVRAALGVLLFSEVRAWIAWSILVRCCCNSLIIPSKFGMGESVTSKNLTALLASVLFECAHGETANLQKKPKPKRSATVIERSLQRFISTSSLELDSIESISSARQSTRSWVYHHRALECRGRQRSSA